jgi:diguanylate cyclase (GGDEF)-like protein/PAS domain S-box-containing protein
MTENPTYEELEQSVDELKNVIFENKQIKNDLEISLSHLRTTLDSTAYGILVVDREGKIILFNKKFAKIWNIPDSVLESKDDNEALSFVLDQLESPQDFLAKAKELYTKPKTECFDTLQFKDGRIFECYSSPHFMSNSVISRVWSFHDVTERIQTEKKLRDSEGKFRNLAENSLVGVYIIQDGIFIYVNAKFADIFGYSVEECLNNMHFRQTVHPEDLDLVRKQISKRVSGEIKSVNYFFRGIKKDGTTIHVEIFGSSIQLNGKAAVVGTTLDITERKQMEEKLKESEKRFRSLFEESRDAIINTDLEGNLLMVNPAGMALFGLINAELSSINFREFYIDSEMARRFTIAIREKGHISDFGVQLRGKGGKIMDCLMTVITKQSDDGSSMGYEGIIRNVTPYKKMEEELRRLATIDSLTGINNRRNFLDLAGKEISRSSRYDRHLSMVMLDIDHFKKVNDTYGHSVGDKVLIEFCEVCLKQLRENDVMGRLGGEEFAIVLVECDTEMAALFAERIRQAVASHVVSIGSEEIRFTVSLGVTGVWQGCDLNSILERADNALYRAKENGRNQVQSID